MLRALWVLLVVVPPVALWVDARQRVPELQHEEGDALAGGNNAQEPQQEQQGYYQKRRRTYAEEEALSNDQAKSLQGGAFVSVQLLHGNLADQVLVTARKEARGARKQRRLQTSPPVGGKMYSGSGGGMMQSGGCGKMDGGSGGGMMHSGSGTEIDCIGPGRQNGSTVLVMGTSSPNRQKLSTPHDHKNHICCVFQLWCFRSVILIRPFR